MKYAVLIALAILQLVLGIVLRYKRHDKVSRAFMNFTLILFIWTFINSVLDYLTHDGLQNASSPNLTLINVLNTSGFAAASVLLLLLYMSVRAVLGEPPSNSRITIWTGIFVAFLSLFPVSSGQYSYASGMLTYHYGPASLLLIPYFFLLAGLAVKATIKELRTNKSANAKQQAATMFFALFLSGAWALIFIIIIPVITHKDETIFIGYLAPYFFTLLTYYCIIWLGFLNFGQLVARSVGYILSLLGIGAVSIIIVNLIVGVFLHKKLSTPEIVIFTCASFLIGALFQPAKRFFDKYTNKIFYRDAYDAQSLYDSLNRLMVSSLDLEYVMNQSAHIISDSLKPEHCSILIESPRHKLRSFGDSLAQLDENEFAHLSQLTVTQKKQIISIDYLDGTKDSRLKQLMITNGIAVFALLTQGGHAKGEQVGFIVMGPKRSGNPYSTSDIHTLEAVANGLVLAIQNVLRFEEISNFSSTLQNRVDEATKKLRASNEKLKKIDETKDEFISMASHQLRTPLTSVKGYLSMVLEGDAGPLKPQQRELLKQSFLSSERMVNLIADLLNLSRLNTGKFVIDAKLTDLRMIVDQEVAQLRESAKAKNISFTWDMPPTFTLVELDEGKMHQVVMNFIDNAIYYTPEGGSITVELTESDSSVEFRVKDSGIGVPRELQRHLFTKFYRADNARRMRPDGTGLGIYMAKKVVVAQGGSILFESEQGKGSTFGFRFNKNKK